MLLSFYYTNLFFKLKFAHKQVFPQAEINWTKIDCNYLSQKDGYNCGVFVIYFAEQIMETNIAGIGTFKPNEKREDLKELILVNSSDMSEV